MATSAGSADDLGQPQADPAGPGGGAAPVRDAPPSHDRAAGPAPGRGRATRSPTTSRVTSAPGHCPTGDEHRPALPGPGHQPARHRAPGPAPGVATTTMSTPSSRAATTPAHSGPGRGARARTARPPPPPRRRRPARAGAGRPPRTTTRPPRPSATSANSSEVAPVPACPQHRDGAAPAQDAAGEQRPQRRRDRQRPLDTPRDRLAGVPDQAGRPDLGEPRRPGLGSARSRAGCRAGRLPATATIRSSQACSGGQAVEGGLVGHAQGEPPPRRRTARPPGPGRRPPGW